MKRKYLLTFALAGMLVFGNAPITVNAASPNAGGTVVDDQQGNAGDELNIDESGVPLTNPEDDATKSTEIAEEDTPLAVLSSDSQTKGGFSWWGFVAGVLTTGVVGTGAWAVLKARGDKKK